MLPHYSTESKGDPHRYEFRSTVEVGGKLFQSHQWHSRRKDAEQDAARVAYESLVTVDDDPTDADDNTNVLGLIDQVSFFGYCSFSLFIIFHFMFQFVLSIVYRILNHVSSAFPLVVCLTINNAAHNLVFLSLPIFCLVVIHFSVMELIISTHEPVILMLE